MVVVEVTIRGVLIPLFYFVWGQTFPPEERVKKMVEIGLQRKTQSAEATQKCTSCWMYKVRTQRPMGLDAIYLWKDAPLGRCMCTIAFETLCRSKQKNASTIKQQGHCICGKLPTISLPLDFVVLLHYKVEHLNVIQNTCLIPPQKKNEKKKAKTECATLQSITQSRSTCA